MHLAEQPPERWTPVREVSEGGQISHNHLLKVVRQLALEGIILSKRGVAGGVRLAKPPSEIQIGTVLRLIEPSFRMLPPALDEEADAVNKIHQALDNALGSLVSELNNATLADFAAPKTSVMPSPSQDVRTSGRGIVVEMPT